jgi:hypothetical protein
VGNRINGGAVKAVRVKNMDLLKASKLFNILRATLKETGMILASIVSVDYMFLLGGQKKREMGGLH